jgi:hypothetical protein
MKLPSEETLYWTMVFLLFLFVVLGLIFDTNWSAL